MKKYDVYQDGGFLVVKVEEEETTEYYHVGPYSKNNPKLVCDGDGPLCHTAHDCQHIKAARRFTKKKIVTR